MDKQLHPIVYVGCGYLVIAIPCNSLLFSVLMDAVDMHISGFSNYIPSFYVGADYISMAQLHLVLELKEQ